MPSPTLDPHIVRHHAAISDTEARFLDYAVTQGRCLDRLALLDDSVHPMFRDYAYTLNCWPWFLGPDMKRRLEDCVRHIPTLIQQAVAAEFEDDPGAFSEFFNLPLAVAHLFLDGEADADTLVQRMDAVLTAEGLKLVEMNIGSGIGGWAMHWLDGQYRRQPDLAPFLAAHESNLRSTPREFMAFLVRTLHAQDLPLTVLLLVDETFIARGGPQAFAPLYDAALAEQGCRGTLHFATSFDAVDCKADGAYLRGTRLGALLGAHAGTLVAPPPLNRAAFARQLFLPDSPLSVVLGDKRALALLHRHKDDAGFSREQRAAIDAFIPWAAPVVPGPVQFEGHTQDLGHLLLQERGRFVVKPARGARGDHVFIGRHIEAAQWARIVQQALGESGWLAQAFCASLPFHGQHGERGCGVFDLLWGFFGFGPRYGGCRMSLLDRQAGNGVVNCAQGAEEAIVYEVVR